MPNRPGCSWSVVDLSPAVVEQARLRCRGLTRIEVADLARPLALETGSFDGVICSLALHYLRDWDVLLASFAGEFCALVGWVVLSLDHPFGPPLAGQQGGYFDSELVSDTWTKDNVTVTQHFRRRPLGAVAGAFATAGFTIERIIEPQPSVGAVERFPVLQEVIGLPCFIVYRLRLTPASGAR